MEEKEKEEKEKEKKSDSKPLQYFRVKEFLEKLFGDKIRILGEETSGKTGWFEIDIGGEKKSLHSKKNGDGFIDSFDKENKLARGIAEAINLPIDKEMIETASSFAKTSYTNLLLLDLSDLDKPVTFRKASFARKLSDGTSKDEFSKEPSNSKETSKESAKANSRETTKGTSKETTKGTSKETTKGTSKEAARESSKESENGTEKRTTRSTDNGTDEASSSKKKSEKDVIEEKASEKVKEKETETQGHSSGYTSPKKKMSAHKSANRLKKRSVDAEKDLPKSSTGVHDAQSGQQSKTMKSGASVSSDEDEDDEKTDSGSDSLLAADETRRLKSVDSRVMNSSLENFK
uniref:Uncharacterized protein n=1 Tax=Strigamia maritima TaxID=126957 RepID=T1IWN8_STRMM